MAQYSEIVGSFKRQGSFPLEAEYIFASEETLVTWANLPEIKPTLHKGLFKIVEGPNSQSLYWVIEKDNELVFKKVITEIDIEDIVAWLEKLEEHIWNLWGTDDPTTIPEDINSIADLANAVTDIRAKLEELDEFTKLLKTELKATVGTTEDDIVAYLETLDYKNLTSISEALHKFLNTLDPDDPKVNTLPEIQAFLDGYTDQDTLADIINKLHNDILGDPLPSIDFRTLRGIEDWVRLDSSKQWNDLLNLHTEVNATQVGVGLDSDGKYSADQETNYLKTATSVMNALKILDSLINLAINNVNLVPVETETVQLDIKKYADKTTIEGHVRVSDDTGQGIIVKGDGIFMKVMTEYVQGILTTKVNDVIVAQHSIAMPSVVESATYDSATESIIIVFHLLDGTTDEVRIDLHNLIEEWVIKNDYPHKVVELARERNTSGGADLLSADVRISNTLRNILTKDGNSLLVDGSSDNIIYEPDGRHLEVIITQLLNDIALIGDAVNNVLFDAPGTFTFIQKSGNRLVYTIPEATELMSGLMSKEDKAKLNNSYTKDEVDEIVTQINNKITEIEGNITTIQGDITNIKTDITNIQGDVTTIQGDITNIKEDITNIEGNITTINENITTIQGDITEIKEGITVIEGDITNIKNDITNIQEQLETADLPDLTARVVALEEQMVILKSDATVEGSIDYKIAQALETAQFD